MTKTTTNVRGDSGLSDSQAIRSQKMFFKKNKEAFEEMEKRGKMEMDRRRFEANAKRPNKTLWHKIINFLGL